MGGRSAGGARPDHGEPDRRPYRRGVHRSYRDDDRRGAAAGAEAARSGARQPEPPPRPPDRQSRRPRPARSRQPPAIDGRRRSRPTTTRRRAARAAAIRPPPSLPPRPRTRCRGRASSPHDPRADPQNGGKGPRRGRSRRAPPRAERHRRRTLLRLDQAPAAARSSRATHGRTKSRRATAETAAAAQDAAARRLDRSRSARPTMPPRPTTLLSRARAHEPLEARRRPSPFTEKVGKGNGTLYRARFAGLDSASAESACRSLKRERVLLLRHPRLRPRRPALDPRVFRGVQPCRCIRTSLA